MHISKEFSLVNTEVIMCTDKDTRHVLEILAPEGQHEIISIPAEQAAPMADLAVFTK